MENSVLIAGFGGQGVILIGQLLGYSATSAGKSATFYPSYGAEQRGGTANCTVVIADEEIGSPVVSKPNVLIAMNDPSLVKFENWVRPGGTIIVNSSLCTTEVSRDDIKVVKVAASEIADQIGSPKALNMVLLGSYLEVSAALPVESVIETMKIKLARKAKFLPLNEMAIKAGFEAAAQGA